VIVSGGHPTGPGAKFVRSPGPGAENPISGRGLSSINLEKSDFLWIFFEKKNISGVLDDF
jgi:hypothetical protein